MSERESIIAKVAAIAERVAASKGLEIAEIEFLGGGKDRTLRLFIDRPPAEGQTVPVGAPFGVTLEDCELVSHEVGTILDVEDVMPGGTYKLEVSSPGIERKLLRPVDYQRFQGHRAKLRLRVDSSGNADTVAATARTVEGVLSGFRDGIVTIDPGKGTALEIPLSQIERANLKFVW